MISTKKIDSINLLLIPICLGVAYVLPVRLFLYSYAILGPLHYLTEINWLQEKNFFSKSKKGVWWVTGILCVLLSLNSFFYLPWIRPYTEKSETLVDFLEFLFGLSDLFVITALFAGVSLAITKKWWITGLSILAGILISLWMKEIRLFHLIIGIFTPTLLHVYVFTGAFMLFGYIKASNKMGMLSVLLHFSVPLAIVFLPLYPTTYKIPEAASKAFYTSGFQAMNQDLVETFGLERKNIAIFYKFQIFIAYAYVYHYLNWFSKTSVIGWGKALNKKRLLMVIAIAGISIGTYFYDYKVGLRLLFFLSMLHVFLEFPLNYASFKGIIQSVLPNKK